MLRLLGDAFRRSWWFIIIAPFVAGAVVFIAAGRTNVVLWSSTASLQVGRMASSDALLGGGQPESSLELIENGRDLVEWASRRTFSAATVERAGIDPVAQAADVRLFSSSFHARAVTDSKIRFDLAATSPEAARALMQAAVSLVIERHAEIAKKRHALSQSLIANYDRDLEKFDAAQAAGSLRPGPSRLDDRIPSLDILVARGWGEELAKLYGHRMRLRVIAQLREPTTVSDQPSVERASRHPMRFYASLLSGIATLFFAVVIALVLSARRMGTVHDR